MLKWLNGDVGSKGRIGITCGCFDLLHAGHATMLAEAKQHCDYLIVALQDDPSIDRPEKNKPIQSIFERQLQLAAIRFVDDIIVYNTEADLLDVLKSLPIDLRIIGSDYVDKDFTGKQYCVDNDIDIVYNSRDHSFSTSDLRKRVTLARHDK
ncbi:MAG: adenylyltransferase/cytidyltransferase family protein [Methylophagaceae bacterium]|jgi:glycerol-3-phosphate cytidylyltransferase|tara:strand:- start:8984 stop:9439 length:456 start_codon:yes stop_codon:yes gene_type:complete